MNAKQVKRIRKIFGRMESVSARTYVKTPRGFVINSPNSNRSKYRIYKKWFKRGIFPAAQST